jgi:hypothetical protein
MDDFQRVWPLGYNYDPDLDLCFKLAGGFSCGEAIAQRRLRVQWTIGAGKNS